MIGIHSDNGFVKTLDGIRMKTVNVGDHMLMVEFRLAAGHQLPLHSHPHEQSGYLVNGRMRMKIGENNYALYPGDNWCVPSGVIHQVDVIEDCVVVEVFSPVREEYRQYMYQADVKD